MRVLRTCLVCCLAFAVACKGDPPTKNNGDENNGSPGNNGQNNGENNGDPDPDNDPPEAVDDMATVAVNSALLIDVLANDTDPDGDVLSLKSVGTAQNGSPEIEGNRVRYTPARDFAGVDSFQYTVEDPSGATSIARVRLIIESGPIANPDTATAQPGQTLVIDVLANDNHPQGGALTIDSVEDPLGGTASTDGQTVTYVSDVGTSGLDEFDYTVVDETGARATATITVDVNSAPTATPDTATATRGQTVTIDVLANDTDPDGDTLTIASIPQPATGQTAIVANKIEYTAPADFGGVDSFRYAISDGHGNESVAEVQIAVNSPPVVVDDASKVFVNEPRTIDVLANDSDPDGDTLTVTGVTQPSSGSATTDGSTVLFTPGVDFEGIVTFDYTVSDGVDGTATGTVTVEVEPPFEGLKLASGNNHNCRIRSNGTLVCWGDNTQGQLGDGSRTDQPGPTPVGSATDWRSVSAGRTTTCGVRGNGTLWCAGSNSDRQFGVDTPSSSQTMIQVNSDTDWLLVSTGDRHTCALKETGELFCSGWNLDGEIGIGSNSTWVDQFTRVGGQTDWTLVTAGDGHTCGLRGIGQLWCWGENSSDQLGDPNLRDSSVPAQIGTDQNWDYLDAGRYYTCGIRNGALFCWGSGYRGQLGNGGTGSVESPQQIGSATDWTDVSANYDHTCGIRGGELWCWGQNLYGQLGDGTTDDRTLPTRVGTTADWQNVSVGQSHTCATKTDGTAHCWGRDSDGSLGDGEMPGSLVPQQITSNDTFVDVSVNYGTTCAVKDDGTLWCWGGNDDGQLANGTTDPEQLPQQSGFSTDWVSISHGTSFFCGHKTNDSMWCWGNNWLGMLGDGSRDTRLNPTLIGGGATWATMDGTSQHSCGTQTDGTMWCWGQNSRDQFGVDSSVIGQSLFPYQVGTDADWDQAEVGGYMSCGIKAGQLWCWGQNYGAAPVQVGTDTNWRQISIADDEICGLRTNDTLWCWDSRRNPQTPTQIVSDTDWDYVDAQSVSHKCAIKQNGTLWCWGNNSNGQLGDGTTINKTSPNPIGSATWLDVATTGGTFGGGHTCGIQMDGTLWCWGSDLSGQLGVGGAWVTTPQPVAP